MHVIQDVLVSSTTRLGVLEDDIKHLKGTLNTQNKELVELKNLCAKQGKTIDMLLPGGGMVQREEISGEDIDSVSGGDIDSVFGEDDVESSDTVRLYRIGRIDSGGEHDNKQILIEFKDDDSRKKLERTHFDDPLETIN